LKSNDLKLKSQETLSHTCDFLNVGQLINIDIRNVYARPYESSMSDKERVYLESAFEQEIKELEHELNWDCSEWLFASTS